MDTSLQLVCLFCAQYVYTEHTDCMMHVLLRFGIQLHRFRMTAKHTIATCSSIHVLCLWYNIGRQKDVRFASSIYKFWMLVSG